MTDKDKLYTFKAFGYDIITLQMQGKMLFTITCLIFAGYLILFSIACRIMIGTERVSQLRTWGMAKIIAPVMPNTSLSLHKNGKVITASAAEFAASPTLEKWINGYLIRIILAAILSLPIWLFFPIILKKYKIKEQQRVKPKYLDGAKLLSPADFKNQIETKYKDTYLPFGGFYEGKVYYSINLPTEVENAHIAVIGGTRSGKTVMLTYMLTALRQRGDIAVILDQKGDYIENFWNHEKDHVLNVLDDRCMIWNFWDDLEQNNTLLRQAEIETMASGLIPDAKDGGGVNQFFQAGARDVLIGLITWLDREGKYTYADLWQTINQPRDQISKILTGINHRGQVFVAEAGKQSQGILSVLIQYGRVFEYASSLDNLNISQFRIKEWLNEGSGFVYLTNYDAIRDTLRPMLSMFTNFLAKKILTGKENRSGRRIWLFLDEFGSLHKLDALIDVLTRGGSKGVCVVLASQDRAQIDEIYGSNLTDAIFNSCNSWAILRCVDPATAKLAVDKIGEWRFERQEESVSDRFDDGGDSINIQKKIVREKLLLDSEVMRQDPLTAFIHVDGCDYAHVNIEEPTFVPQHPVFIPRKGTLPQPDKIVLDQYPAEITPSRDDHKDMEIGV